MMEYLKRLGRSLMLPIACLPICGILMGIGYWLCPASMQGGRISGAENIIGLFLVKAAGAILDNMAVLFVVGVGIGLSHDNHGVGGLSALVAWFVMTTLLEPKTVTNLIPSIIEDVPAVLAFGKINNPFVGILAGIIGSSCYNRYKTKKIAGWLSFFSGKRFVVIASGFIAILVGVVLLFLWPNLYELLMNLGKNLVKMGPLGAAIYAFLNRLLIPVGLHHALNNVFWFSNVGLGDLTNFWAHKTSADVSWDLGMYMSGSFPPMMFGIPGAALAIIQKAKQEKNKAMMGFMVMSAVASFLSGVTEPFEFCFMFLAPVLYIIYALLYGVFTYITLLTGFRAGFSFSAGLTDLIFSSHLPAAQNTQMIIPLGIAAFVVFYLVFHIAIAKFSLLTGKEEDSE